MLRGLYSTTSAMLQLQAKQSITTNNIANINTPGYKYETMVEKPFGEYLISNNDKYVEGEAKSQKLGDLSMGVKMDDIITNFSQSNLIQNDIPTSFGIIGEGFFSITDNKGQVGYTRDGVFKVSSDGYLVNSAGYRVQGKNSKTGLIEPIKIASPEDIVTIDVDNNIVINGEISYTFNIVKPNNVDSFLLGQNNLYYGGGGTTQINPSQYTIKQKYKEASNVDMIQETTDMMSTMRAFEANQTVMKAIDSTLNLVANNIGRI